MIEILNKRNYCKYVSTTSLLVLLAGIVVFILKPVFLLGEVLFFFVIELIFLSQRFTQKIVSDSMNLTIDYYSFLSLKQITIPINEVDFKIGASRSLRSPTYYTLDILKKKEKFYQIDSRDGFAEGDLQKITQATFDEAGVVSKRTNYYGNVKDANKESIRKSGN